MTSQAAMSGTAPASSGQTTVEIDGEQYTAVREGLAQILVPKSAGANAIKDATTEQEAQRVFYNPIQQFNRDLTVLAIKAYGEEVVTMRRSASERKLKRKRDDGQGDRERQSKATKAQNSTIENCTDAPAATAEATQGSSQLVDGVLNGTEAHQGNGTEKSTEADGKQHREARQPDPPRFTVLDALSASGLRALRYAHELPFISSVTANDLTASAVESINRNVQYNQLADKIKVNQGDALAHMYTLVAEELTRQHASGAKSYQKNRLPPSQRYDVIDLDPYGTAATFLDAAVQAVRDDGGLLCVTCTDSGVWASHGYSEKAYSLYGGIPIKGEHSHEGGLRLILHSIATSAARYGLAIEPLLSLSIDYYCRIFVRVRKSPASVKFLAGKTMLVYSCDSGCGAWETQLIHRNRKVPDKKGTGTFYKYTLSQGPTADSLCKHCGSKMHVAGPMYGGRLHSPEFIQKILKDLPNASKDTYGTTARIEGMLNTALEEFLAPPEDNKPSSKDDNVATVDPYPFFFHPSRLSSAISCQCPSEDNVRGAIRHLGYEVTRSHCKPGSLKTNAPWSVIWHIMREWVRQKAPVREDRIKEGSPGYRLLRLDRKGRPAVADEEKENSIDKMEVVFDVKLGRDKSKKGLVRYQLNPAENWGPQKAATGH